MEEREVWNAARGLRNRMRWRSHDKTPENRTGQIPQRVSVGVVGRLHDKLAHSFSHFLHFLPIYRETIERGFWTRMLLHKYITVCIYITYTHIYMHTFSASLLQSSVSHDPSENHSNILICYCCQTVVVLLLIFFLPVTFWGIFY